jgi:acyl-CoA thioesterase-1
MKQSWSVGAPGLVALVALGALACSRRHEARAEPAPAPPTSKESTTLSGSLDVASAVPAALTAVVAAPPPPRSLAGKKVLHVGDSMVGGGWGLTRALEAKLTAEGAQIVRHTKVSESLTSFDKSPTLRDLLRTHSPDIVVINLGANDALVPHPEVFVKSIRNIVGRVGDRECWWLGPPMWQKDTGIVAVIRDNVAPCRFFDSSKLELERASDGIHPNERGSAKWANAFWQVFKEPPPVGVDLHP